LVQDKDLYYISSEHALSTSSNGDPVDYQFAEMHADSESMQKHLQGVKTVRQDYAANN
jgi:hypothetical protein